MHSVCTETAKTGLIRDTKARVVEEFSETPSRVLGKKPETIHIVIETVDDEDGGHAGSLVVNTRQLKRD
jgi:4-oxalocrotonate tautomerase